MNTRALILVLIASTTLQDRLSGNYQDFLQNQFVEILRETERLNAKIVTSFDVTKLMKMYYKSYQKVTNTLSYVLEANSKPSSDDLHLTIPAIITRHGFQCETHTVQSQGYILKLHRIPSSKHGTISSRTVLLQHGMFGSSAVWVLNGPERALAYALADEGYDVWMANIRGNKYSREHAWLDTDSKAFWNFSWHDVALYDIPAVIDYIVSVKGSGTKIAYMGHSMGTTIMFAMLTLRPEYNDVLTAGYALAPFVPFTNFRSPIKYLAPFASKAAYFDSIFGAYEFIPKNTSLSRLTGICSVSKAAALICKNVLFSICGRSEKQYNETLLPVFLSHLGTGTSWKTVVHFAQEIVSGKFQQFDYGTNDNHRVYGSDSPPEYDLSKVTLPIKLFWSPNDLLSSEEDVRSLQGRLAGKVDLYTVPLFNHLDFIFAIDAANLLDVHILDSLNNAFKNSSD